MSIGRMNVLIDIIRITTTKDNEGFGKTSEEVLASVRAYKEDRFATERWANMAVFSEANALFRFRKIPGISITSDLTISCKNERYNIVSISDIKNKGMYIEVMAKKVVASSG